jgi:hypothetical protein
MSQAHIHEMIRSVSNLIAISMMYVEVALPNGFWTYTGVGILLINFIHFLKSELNEQENN